MYITNTSYEDLMTTISFINQIGNNIDSKYRNYLRKHEDKMFDDNYKRVAILDNFEMIRSATFPFSNDENDIDKIDKLWIKKDCCKCKNVVHRHAMPTGNLKPKYLIVGEAPGVSDGEKKLERVMGYGPTSILLKMALINAGVIDYCWFTNIMKCAFCNNKCDDVSQYTQCADSLFSEIEILKPIKIIALGNKVQQFFAKYDKIKVTKIIHPSFCLYRGISYEKYAKNFIF